MLDDLLGRTALKERIAEIERENERLEERLQAEERRRAEAVTAKQEAEREVNRLESKIAELEGRLEDDEDGDGRSFRVATECRRDATDRVLTLLSSAEAPGDDLVTATLPPGAAPPDRLPSRVRAALQRIDADTGRVAVVDRDGVLEACLVPPIRVDEVATTEGDRFEVPEELFAPPERYVLAVVRSDSFAAGLYVDGERERAVEQSSAVKGGHSKGGFSQSRFERIRDDQIRRHLEASYAELEPLLGEDLDRVAVVGDRGMANDLAEEFGVDCPVQVGTVDATGSGEALLEDGHEAFWTSRLYVV